MQTVLVANRGEIAVRVIRAARDARAIHDLHDVLLTEVTKRGGSALLAEVELPLVPTLVEMQATGIAVDLELLRELESRFADDVAELAAWTGFRPATPVRTGIERFVAAVEAAANTMRLRRLPPRRPALRRRPCWTLPHRAGCTR